MNLVFYILCFMYLIQGNIPAAMMFLILGIVFNDSKPKKK